MSQPKQRASTVGQARGNKSFAKAARMPSAKSQVESKRNAVAAVEGEYLGAPPEGQDLIQIRYVIPGKHMLPRALDDPAALDSIRKTHKVWITTIAPNIFNFTGDSIVNLNDAVQAMNDAVHDMRLSNDQATTRYSVQRPVRSIDDDVLIKLELGSRPCLTTMSTGPCDMSIALAGHLQALASDLVPSAHALMVVDKELRMRVNFGRLNIRQKKRGLGTELTYGEFEKVMKAYSLRGGAKLETWLADTGLLAESVFQHLTDPSLGICSDEDNVRSSYSLTLKVDDQELLVDAIILPDSLAQLSAVRISKPESMPRLNWTMAAPDMKFDWNLQVSSHDVSAGIPSGLQELVQGMSLRFSRPENNADNQAFIVPSLTVRKPGNWEVQVSETRLKTSVCIPVQDTPYEIEMSITQVWKGLKTAAEPETGWGIEIYGVHWDEAMNQVSPGQRKKDWGAGLENIWAGTDPSPENRFGEFLQIVLKVQAALEDAGPVAT